MVNANFQKEMEKIIENVKDKRPKLLLHSCCAPCSSYCLTLLNEYFDADILFYNPNMDSEEEFNKRLTEQKRLIEEMNLENIKVIDTIYCEKEFLDFINGQEDLPEGSVRCKKCYQLRMNKSAEYAKLNGYDYFTTTLSISPLKNATWINEIGQALASELGINYLVSDFKKKGGYQKSIELSKKFNLYRQNYCGCRFSKKQTEITR